MQAIISRFVPCTNFRPSRVSARCAGGSVMLSWDDDLSAEENHQNAAKALCAKLEWNCSIQTGALTDSYVHTLSIPKKRLFVFATEKKVVSRTYGGADVTVRIYEVVEGALRFCNRAKWCTRSFKGAESEVMNALANNGVIGAEYTGYFERYNMPFSIEGI